MPSTEKIAANCKRFTLMKSTKQYQHKTYIKNLKKRQQKKHGSCASQWQRLENTRLFEASVTFLLR